MTGFLDFKVHYENNPYCILFLFLSESLRCVEPQAPSPHPQAINCPLVQHPILYLFLGVGPLRCVEPPACSASALIVVLTLFIAVCMLAWSGLGLGLGSGSGLGPGLD